MKILFVCSANTIRSPTFEKWFSQEYEEHEFKSSGCWHGYPDKMSEELLDWADHVFVMDLSHRLFIHKKYPKYLSKVEVIGISDQYDPDEDDLIELCEYWNKTHFKEFSDER